MTYGSRLFDINEIYATIAAMLISLHDICVWRFFNKNAYHAHCHVAPKDFFLLYCMFFKSIRLVV